MIAPVEMQQKLAQVFSDRQAFVLTDVIQAAYSDLVRTSDFNELKEIVRDLAVAQKRTEQRVEELATAQEKLAIAQENLTIAQHGTELALQQLTRQVGGLSGRLDALAEQVGGLSDRMGGDLEDIAAIVLPDVLMREYGWRADVLPHTWQRWNGKEEEVDLFGQANDPARPDLPIWIVGEVKFNLTMKHLERFVKKVARARRHLQGEVFAVCFCYRVRPEVQRAVTAAGFRLVFAYGRIL
jgi:hypothetical protein